MRSILVIRILELMEKYSQFRPHVSLLVVEQFILFLTLLKHMFNSTVNLGHHKLVLFGVMLCNFINTKRTSDVYEVIQSRKSKSENLLQQMVIYLLILVLPECMAKMTPKKFGAIVLRMVENEI